MWSRKLWNRKTTLRLKSNMIMRHMVALCSVNMIPFQDKFLCSQNVWNYSIMYLPNIFTFYEKIISTLFSPFFPLVFLNFLFFFKFFPSSFFFSDNVPPLQKKGAHVSPPATRVCFKVVFLFHVFHGSHCIFDLCCIYRHWHSYYNKRKVM